MKKKCFKCKRIKDITLFYMHPMMSDGHLGKCKSCTKKDVNKRYVNPATREKIREYEKKRFQTEHRKNKITEYALKRKYRFPGKNRARSKIGQLKKKGLFKDKLCEICKLPNPQAHHIDYRKPLDVRWLCFKHHRETHGQKVGKLL